MFKNAAISLLVVLLAACTAAAQSRSSENEYNIIEEIMTNACESENENDQDNAVINSEYLLQWLQNPVDLNSCSLSQLKAVPVLSEIQAEKIMEYRSKYGDFGSLGELKSIVDGSETMLRWLQPFLTAGEPGQRARPSFWELLKSGKHSLVNTFKATLDRQEGYRPDSAGNAYYDGSPLAWCVKYRFSAGNRIAWGITMEKDAGEPLAFGGRRYGFDFNSGFVRIDDLGCISRLVVGDYTASFGQGLILGGGMGMGKFSAGQPMTGSGCAVREYGSCNEGSFLRGAAATFRAGKASITAFGSCNLVDAACDGEHSFRALKTDGLHRCGTELMRKDCLRETHAGIIASRTAGNLRIGAAAHYFCYDKTLAPAREIRNANMRSMRQGVELSASYQYCWRMVSFYGETALDAAQKAATINFIDFAPTGQLRVSLMHRMYSKQYQAMRASSFGQNSRVCNEEGFYGGIMARPASWLQISAWADIFRIPWLSYQVNEPTTGHECSAASTIAFSKNAQLQIKGKRKQKQTSDSGRVESGYLKAVLSCSPASGLRLSTAAQWSRSSQSAGKEHGYLAYQNAQYSMKSGLITLSARYALFSAPYSARIYSYENDVSFFFSAPAYYYKGSRYYLVAGTSIVPNASIQIRFSEWNYSDRQQISSGHSLIHGHRKHEISVYVKYTF